MSLFHLEVDSDTKMVRLKDVNHKYLAQVGQAAVQVWFPTFSSTKPK